MLNIDQERILTKVRKLIALAECKGASEGERDNALRMAHAMLSRHNLSMGQVAHAGLERQRVMLDCGEEWAIPACMGIAELFFCRYYMQRVRDSNGAVIDIHHYFAGQTANALTAQAMASYVIDSIGRQVIAQKGLNALDSILDGATVPRYTENYKASFAQGAADAVLVKCRELKASNGADNANGTTGTDIVPVAYYDQEKAANEAYLFNQWGVKLVQAKVKAFSGTGYAQGKAFGESINLSRQVGSAANAPRLGHKGK
jgi:hypothetical protein